jgi:molybdenum cofactor cytidylyltransferase
MARSNVAAIILAAGQSARFREAAGQDAPATKLVALHQGKPMIRHVAETALAAGLAPVIVVTGHAAQEVQAALAGLNVTFIYNADYASGMASSLKTGLAGVIEAEGFLVLLGDMPLVSTSLIEALVDRFQQEPMADAVVPLYQGQRGNPVLLSARLAPAIRTLQGDEGARSLLRGPNRQIVAYSCDDIAVQTDIDTPAALSALPPS